MEKKESERLTSISKISPKYILKTIYVFIGSCMENSRNATKPKVIYIVNNITIPENRTQGCSDNEIQTLDCLNGGVCFTVDEFDRIVLCA